MKRIISAVLASLFLLSSLAACKGDTAETAADSVTGNEGSVTEDENVPEPALVFRAGTDLILPEYDTEDKIIKTAQTVTFEGNGSLDKFALFSGAGAEGSKVIFPKDTVSGIYPLQPAPEDSVSEYSFFLCSPSPSNDHTWFTCYFGLRLAAAGKDATGHNGLWIAMRSDQVGIRYDWPNTGYMKADWDLVNGEKITVTDDPVNNVVTVYAGEEKREIAKITIDGAKIEMYSPGAEKPSVSDKVDSDLPAGGYVYLWNHNTHVPGYADDISATVSITTVEPAEKDGIQPASRDVFYDTYTTFDDAGRAVVSGAAKPNGAKVGMFYFLWHDSNGPLFDHTAAYESGGMDGLWKTMTSGNLGFAHYWAEPYFGYYRSDDEWVIRKHGAMLAEAGIDFVYFDATNGLLYRPCYEAVLRVWSQMRKEGLRTPDVCFLMQNGNSRELSELWNNLYGSGLYSEMWFRWDGRPVIMFTGDSYKLSKEQKEFFTVRVSWANENDDWYKKRKGIDCWAWGTMAPQKGGFTTVDGVKTLEQMIVMCGFWVNGSYGTNAGRSYTRKTGEPKKLAEGSWNMGFGLYPQTSGLGLAYQEQFDHAIESNPKLIMITGWNEWWAGRWEGAPAIGQTIAGAYVVSDDKTKKQYNYYVDNLNPEYSRDLEPMKGGFGDNYYYQTVINTRAYKGSRNVEASFGGRSIAMDGDPVQWYGVGPEFRDVACDTAKRSANSHVGGFRYENDTGKNDITAAKVSYDGQYLYFFAECAEDIKTGDGSNFMNLFINSDGDGQNGWYGFDFVINRARDGKAASVEKFTDGWSTEKAGEADYVISGNTMTVRVDAGLIGYDKKTVDFKWADNSVDDGDVMGFWDKGDAAPDGRFSYRYTTESAGNPAPEGLTSDMAVFKANGYNAYIGGAEKMLVPGCTKATLLASGKKFWLPADVLESIGVKTDGLTRIDHYGVEYVQADEAVKASGKVATMTAEGLLVIADKAVTDTELLDTLYRTLY